MLRSLSRRLYQTRPSLSLQGWARTAVPFQTLRRSTYATTASEPKSPKLQLRNYQLECIKSVISALKRGHKRVGISLATGSGKTVIFTQLIEKIEKRANGGDSTLILAHRRELVEQAARHCRLNYPGKRIEIEMGNIHASGAADITIASVQSINSKDRLDKYNPSNYKLVLVDEAHHIVAPGYMKVLSHFGLNTKRDDSPALVGVSATFARFDGVKLGAAIDEIVYHKDYVDMISDKWLSDVVFTTVESTANLSRVKKNPFGDFQTSDLSEAVNTDEINDITIRSWMAKAANRKSTLVFCVDIAHVRGLTRRFREYGLDARYVTGDTPQVERGEILDAFRRGEFPVLVNCGVFTEGTDIPNIDCIILGRPTRSRNLLVQMIGRGMRLHPDKENCHIIDLVSSLDTGIVTTPTLFGLDPSELVNEMSVKGMRRLKREKAAEAAVLREAVARGEGPRVDSSTAVTFTDYSSVVDLIADTSGERHIRAISDYSWVQVGAERFVLSAPSGSYIRIEKIDQTSPAKPGANSEKPVYRAVEIRSLPPGVSKSPFSAPRELLTATTFSDAVHGADSYAQHAFPLSFISRRQPWRRLAPTQGQLDFINKLRGESSPVKVGDLTKGKAADMITKLKHGARGWFAKIEADQRRKEKQVLVERAKNAREKVKVGPLAA
ncbi:putative mitochondrial ATP-dependent helicase-like protein [Emericellopsis cladophorae]|uniref:Mitochondrial ATP-dependent helicase-like protein n=1 Tax=Emericellopsis cladophorae TaxID=2686198 RepID=A0A9P9Y8C2_9HYPO|nr:putative mitochondrial ATP-dependent helicase-like protein [Emericellopsis cladophorae]KAI6785155.1 putative mitochondrial ATP-dependent helicase-like protein [Emericellopsis cladophorae]